MGETLAAPFADPADNDAFAQLLLRSNLVTPDALRFAREVEQRTGASFDQVLISEGLLDSESLLIAEAEAWGVLPIDLDAVKFDDTLVRGQDGAGQRFLAENWLPIKRGDDGRVFVATAREPSAQRAARIRSAIGAEPRFVATTSWNIKNACLRLFRSEIADSARRSPPPSRRSSSPCSR